MKIAATNSFPSLFSLSQHILYLNFECTCSFMGFPMICHNSKNNPDQKTLFIQYVAFSTPNIHHRCISFSIYLKAINWKLRLSIGSIFSACSIHTKAHQNTGPRCPIKTLVVLTEAIMIIWFFYNCLRFVYAVN